MLQGYRRDALGLCARALEKLGVEVCAGPAVTEVAEGCVTFGGRSVRAETIIWAAGVRASPAAEWLGAAADAAGRIIVAPDLTVPGHPEIFAIGDTVTIAGPTARRCRASRPPRSRAAAMSRASSAPARRPARARPVPLPS